MSRNGTAAILSTVASAICVALAVWHRSPLWAAGAFINGMFALINADIHRRHK